MRTKSATLTDAQIGYVAGLLDGEGSVGLYKRCRKSDHSDFLGPQVRICGTHKLAMETIQKWVGGGLYAPSILLASDKQLYTLYWTKQSEITELLELLEPYLIIKKLQAQLLLSWIALRGTPVQMDNEIVSMLKALNRRGRSENQD
jgi:hypothetical protein